MEKTAWSGGNGCENQVVNMLIYFEGEFDEILISILEVKVRYILSGGSFQLLLVRLH